MILGRIIDRISDDAGLVGVVDAASAAFLKESPRSLVEAFRSVKAELRVHHNTLAVDPEKRRDSRPTVFLVEPSALQQDSMLELVLVDELLNVGLFLIPGVDTQNHQPVVRVF